MLLSDLGALSAKLTGSPVLQDPLWAMPVSTVTPFDIALFVARMSARGLVKEGRRAVELLQVEAIRCKLSGFKGYMPFLGSVAQEPRFFVDDLVDVLNKLGHLRAQLCLVALEEGHDPEWASNLTWRSVLRMSPRSPLTTEVFKLRNCQRHIRLDYVFWEFIGEKVAAPCVGVKRQAEQAFGVDWPEIALLYSRIVLINRVAENESFQQWLKP